MRQALLSSCASVLQVWIVLLVLLMGLTSCDSYEEAEEAAGAATETVEGFLTALKAEEIDAAMELTIAPIRPFLEAIDQVLEPSWAAEWKKMRGGAASWKQDGWGAKDGHVYFFWSELDYIQERIKPPLRERSGNFVILAYTIEYDADSETSLDFIVLPTDDGWRIAEIWFYL